ncbi:ral guanine nucleotide dissociation stimulator-like isoform X2 [Canis lupus familiaris]|nr:ral guanine nucleotide dissociation stimulator-like isoform X2 [Canis lupus familiaris]
MGLEWEEGVICPSASRNWELPCMANRGQRGLKAERASAGKWNLIFPTKPSRTELLEHEVQQLLPTLLHRDMISIFSFLDNYDEFGSTEEVLDLFTKYGCIVAACGDNDAVLQQWKMAIS